MGRDVANPKRVCKKAVGDQLRSKDLRNLGFSENDTSRKNAEKSKKRKLAYNAKARLNYKVAATTLFRLFHYQSSKRNHQNDPFAKELAETAKMSLAKQIEWWTRNKFKWITFQTDVSQKKRLLCSTCLISTFFVGRPPLVR